MSLISSFRFPAGPHRLSALLFCHLAPVKDNQTKRSPSQTFPRNSRHLPPLLRYSHPLRFLYSGYNRSHDFRCSTPLGWKAKNRIVIIPLAVQVERHVIYPFTPKAMAYAPSPYSPLRKDRRLIIFFFSPSCRIHFLNTSPSPDPPAVLHFLPLLYPLLFATPPSLHLD